MLNLLILYCLGEFLCSWVPIDLLPGELKAALDLSFNPVVDLLEGRPDRIGVALTLAVGRAGALNTSCWARGVASEAVDRDVGSRAIVADEREEGNRDKGVARADEVVDRAIFLSGPANSAKELEV